MRFILACACLILPALSAFAAEDWPADELARTAIARNEKTLANLPPFACEMIWTRKPTEVPPAKALLKFSGTARFADWERPGPPAPLSGRIRAVVNNAYIAFNLGEKSRPAAYQYECDGQSPSNGMVFRWTQTQFPPDPLAFPFGTGSQFLKQTMEGYRKAFTCAAESVTDDKGRAIIRMKVYPKNDTGPSDARWAYDFDPDCGYAIVRLAALSQSHPFITQEIELQPGSRPGAWLPRHIRRTDYAGGSSTPTSTDDYDIQLLPGADLSDAAFRTSALNLAPNSILARIPPSGKPGSSLYLIDGVWTPDPIAGRSNPTIRSAPRTGDVSPQWPGFLAATLLIAAVAIFAWTHFRSPVTHSAPSPKNTPT
jgi:hypothetical protein